MDGTTARRLWPAIAASAMLVLVAAAPTVRASFFYNNLIPPPKGTGGEKEVDPPPVNNPPPPPTGTPTTHLHAPEPGTLMLMSIGMAGVGAYRKFRQRNS